MDLLIAIAVVVVVVALVGGVVVHPLLFALVLLAVALFLAGRGRAV